MRSTFPFTLCAALAAAGLLAGRPAWASVQIPVLAAATDQTQREFHQWPPQHPDPQITYAKVLIYHVPDETTPEAITDFYTTTLARDKWGPAVVKVVAGEKYYIYTRDSAELVIHVKRQEKLTVDCLALEFDKPDPGGLSLGEVTLSRRLGPLATGVPVQIDCPDGAVTVNTHDGPDVQFDVKVRAAVGYPLVADTFIKKVQVRLQSDAAGVRLGIDPKSLPNDPDANLAYNYQVVVPAGSRVVVKVDGPANESLQTPEDGRVEINGAVGDADVTTAGPVTVDGATGKVTVRTDGPVILRDLQSDIVARTSGMGIKADGIVLNGSVDLETSDCQVDLRLAAVRDGSLKCVTTNSAIRLAMPPEASVDLTVDGTQKCSGPLSVAPVAGAQKTVRLHGVSNGGKVPFYLATSGGAGVYIENK